MNSESDFEDVSLGSNISHIDRYCYRCEMLIPAGCTHTHGIGCTYSHGSSDVYSEVFGDRMGE